MESDPPLLRQVASLVDEPSLDGEWHKETYVSWLLSNYLNGKRARDFYARDDSPRIKLLIHDPEGDGSAGGNFTP